MGAQSEETRLQPRVDVEYEQIFLVLAVYAIFVTLEALYVKLEAIDAAKDKFRIHREAGNLSIARSIAQQIVHYYNEIEETHQVIDNGLFCCKFR
ncbi:hypothetical protein N7493_006521 [Penicillium malachiteum]|uniref:Uncharacterized protein n=1 Tax=Penicillium malachiteum TaxID=1324776 RepID=A0AAD6HLG4_9EURO|nr:hypothetical protein N7493_006521 [Penicillium malachiteum]